MGSNLVALETAPFVSDGIGHIPLRDRHGIVRAWAIVDEADFAALARHRWCRNCDGYAVRSVGGRKRKRTEQLHRVVMGLPPDRSREVDHVDRDPLNNRRSNLRVVTHAQNQQNMRAMGGYSRYRGVSYDKARGRWTAWGRRDDRRVFLGRFDTEGAANEAAIAWRAEFMPWAVD